MLTQADLDRADMSRLGLSRLYASLLETTAMLKAGAETGLPFRDLDTPMEAVLDALNERINEITDFLRVHGVRLGGVTIQ